MLPGSEGGGGAGFNSIDERSNHLGFLSLSTAQLQGTPSLPVDVESSKIGVGGRSGISIKGESVGSITPSRRFCPSRASRQHMLVSSGKGEASVALIHSSPLTDSHPDSVRWILAPRLPAGRSLATSPSFLIRLSSAEACGTLSPTSRARALTVVPPSVRRSSSRLRCMLRIFLGAVSEPCFRGSGESFGTTDHL